MFDDFKESGFFINLTKTFLWIRPDIVSLAVWAESRKVPYSTAIQLTQIFASTVQPVSTIDDIPVYEAKVLDLALGAYKKQIQYKRLENRKVASIINKNKNVALKKLIAQQPIVLSDEQKEIIETAKRIAKVKFDIRFYLQKRQQAVDLGLSIPPLPDALRLFLKSADVEPTNRQVKITDIFLNEEQIENIVKKTPNPNTEKNST